MKVKIKLSAATFALALVIGGLLLFIFPTKADSNENMGDTGNEEVSTRSYSRCGGIEGCRTSCGCGCRGNPNACGCGD